MCVGGTARHLPRHINRLYRSHDGYFFGPRKGRHFPGSINLLCFGFPSVSFLSKYVCVSVSGCIGHMT